ncbi:MAG: DUF4190 domain-containing protein [Victivallales bacterium]|nr:DUF4190 domain-containing protein [Victivallales bacterium]
MPESTPQSPSPTTLRLAITAAVLGILSFFFIPFCGLAALILGIVALRRINASNGRLLGKGEAITGIALGVWAFVRIPFIVGLFLPPYIAARHKSQESYCTWRLTTIAMVCNSYANETDGRLPTLDSEEFKAILSQFFVDPKLQFECPRSRKKYRIFVNGQERSKINAPANTILAVCDNGHRYDRIMVAFADNHCEMLLPESHGGNGRAEAVKKAIQQCPEGELPVLDKQEYNK